MPPAMKAFVTGGAGFIGSNLVDALLERGDEVAVLDDLSTGRRENLGGRRASCTRPTCATASACAALVAAAAPDVVFHLAAQIDVRRSVADPAFDAAVNVGGTINVLEAARRAGVRRVVNSSTGGAIYGDAAVVPTAEDTPPAPLSPVRAEQARRRGLLRALPPPARAVDRLACATPTSTARARTRTARAAWWRSSAGGCSRAGGRSSSATAARRATTSTSATSWPRTSLAAESDVEGAYNLGTGVETSVLELADALRALGGGRAFEPEHAPERPGEVHRSASTPRAPARCSAGRRARALAEGLRCTLATLTG